MKVLLLGSGGREHALAWKLASSPLLTKLYAAPGNPGIAEDAELVALNISDNAAVEAFCKEHKIDLVVVGPEAPLVAGLVDRLTTAGIKAFGPMAAAARLEGSKSFTKQLCAANNIPTARYAEFTDKDAARKYIEQHGAPIVLKADGLHAGKGVVVAMTKDEALAGLDQVFSMGSSDPVVIEEFLEGEEASYFCFVDGETVLPLTSAQDHKRVFDGDKGPNTGGMGAYSPAPVFTPAIEQRTLDEIVKPTARALVKAGMPYRGVLYIGLMITKDGPKLIEYNVRFGDPECQVLMPRLKDDLLTLMLGACEGGLGKLSVRWRDEVAITVVLATKGYPGAYTSGSEIRGLDEAAKVEGVTIFHAGTKRDGGKLLANGGRVLNVTATGKTVKEAQTRAYKAVDLIDWPEGFCRRDIGWRAL
ncbi:MAG TPA: phosphoribosylamine--glycine ligase [Xanthobacteraceae bacterium]|jgi:phosphoribosylamine--glycine ligase|nr:phosphoribosylamine--glycine ligase [Xanthobacteraceae bacterium]